MSLYTAAGALTIPAQAREVFDVSGAGDTVIATLGVLLAAGRFAAGRGAHRERGGRRRRRQARHGRRAAARTGLKWPRPRPSTPAPNAAAPRPSGRGNARSAVPGTRSWKRSRRPAAVRFATSPARVRRLSRCRRSKARAHDAHPHRARGIRPRAGRRSRAGRRRADRRRSGHRQVDAAAAGVAPRWAPRTARCTSPARNRSSRSRCARSGWDSSTRRSSCSPKCSSRRSSARSTRRAPEVVVIDSIQTVYTEALQSAPGSVAQVRECAAQLTRLAKQRGVVVIFVGHVTKEGAIAGPRVLEHIVDAVLYFEGDPHSSFRLVRAIKNRFGAANELGVFAMTERGLKGVANPSALFLSQHAEAVAGFGDRRHAGRLAAAAGGNPGTGRPRPGRHAAAAGGRARRTSGWRCCWRSCTATAAWTPAATTSSSMPSGVCVSRNRRSTSPCCLPSIHRLKTGHYRPNLWCLVKSVWRGKSARCSAARNGSARPPSSASRPSSFPSANKPKHGVDGVKIVTVDRVGEALAALRTGL